MKASISGGCHCGKIRYSSAALAENSVACHCEQCQRMSGSAVAVRVGLRPGDLVMEGAQWLTTYASRSEGGKTTERSFCSVCGSPMLLRFEGVADLVFIQAGTLDDRSWVRPTAHLWCQHAQPWLRIPDDALAVR